MTRTRSALLALAAPAVGVALLAAVRPGVLVNGVRSPVAWAVAAGILLAGLGVRAVATRYGAPGWLARAASAAVVLALLAVVLAPSFRQRTLVEDFPAAVPLAAAVAPTAPRSAPAAVAPAAVAPSRAAPAAQPAAPSAQPAAQPPAPRRLATGRLDGIGHTASGGTSLYELDGRGVVRFEDIDVEGTVEPSAHLVRRGARTPGSGVRLGPLKAERGSFSYALPGSVDLAAGWTVLIWCDPFDTPIAAADLG